MDPLESKYSPQSPYNYGNSNPVTFNDPSGEGGEDTTKGIWYSIKNEKTGLAETKWDANMTLQEYQKQHGDNSNYGRAFKSKKTEWSDGTYVEYSKDGIETNVEYHWVQGVKVGSKTVTDHNTGKSKTTNLGVQKEEATPVANEQKTNADVSVNNKQKDATASQPIVNTRPKTTIVKPLHVSTGGKVQLNVAKPTVVVQKPQSAKQTERPKQETGSSGTLLSLIGLGLQYVETGLETYKENEWMSRSLTVGEQWGNKIGGYITKGVGWAGKGLGIFGTVKSLIALKQDFRNPANWIKAGANIGMLFLKANPIGLGIGIGFTILDEGGYIDSWFGNKK